MQIDFNLLLRMFIYLPLAVICFLNLLTVSAAQTTSNTVNLLSWILTSNSSSSSTNIYQLTFDSSPDLTPSNLVSYTTLTLQSLTSSSLVAFNMQNSSSTVYSINSIISPFDYDYDRTITLSFSPYTTTVTNSSTNTTYSAAFQINPASTSMTIDGLIGANSVSKKVLDILVWVARGLVYAIYFVTLLVHLISGGKDSLCMRFTLILSRVLFMQYLNLRFPLNVWIFLGMQVLPDRDLFIPTAWIQSVEPAVSTVEIYNSQNSLTRTTNFIDNVGAYTFIFLCLLVIWIVILLPIHCLFRKKKRCQSAMAKFTNTIRWNLILTLLFAGLNGFLISGLANLRNISLNSGIYNLLGFIFSVVMLSLVAIGILFFPAQQFKKGWISRKLVPTSQVLSSDFVDSRLGKLFIFFYVIADFLLSFSATFLSSYPLAQNIIQLPISAIIIGFLIFSKIFKHKLQKVLAIFFEVTVILLLILLMLIFEDDNTQKILSIDVMVDIGWAFIGCLMLFLILELVYALYRLKKLFSKQNDADEATKQALPVKAEEKTDDSKKIIEIDVKRKDERESNLKDNEVEKKNVEEAMKKPSKENIKGPQGQTKPEKTPLIISENNPNFNLILPQVAEKRVVENPPKRIKDDFRQGADNLKSPEDFNPKTSLLQNSLKEMDNNHATSLNESKIELLNQKGDDLELSEFKGRSLLLKRRRELDDNYEY